MMNKHINPFPVQNYISKLYFCDREIELKTLHKNVQNNVNTTLISARRLGKTGLIFRFFEYLNEKKEIKPVYIDIYSTRNLADFVTLLADAILKEFPSKTSPGKQFMKLLKGFRPAFTFDEITGNPQVVFNYRNQGDKEFTLQKLMEFLEKQSSRVVVAIDEFQQIAEYPEKNTEAILRTCIQQLKNVNFIFSGSRKHSLVEMFISAKRPFYSSTRILNLESLNEDIYKKFITDKFLQGGRIIDEESISYILEWTKGYTFYTQYLCNSLYAHKKINVEKVKSECLNILNEQQSGFLQYRNLLTVRQWGFLVALAKEEYVSRIYNSAFLIKYDFGSPSSAKRILESLIGKEMVLEIHTQKETGYCVYDVFLMRWLQRTY